MKPIIENIKGAKVIRIEGAGHLAPFDSPEKVNDAMVPFLQSIQWK